MRNWRVQPASPAHSHCCGRRPCRRWRCCCCCSGAGAASASGAASVSAAATAGRTTMRARGTRAFTLQVATRRELGDWLNIERSAGHKRPAGPGRGAAPQQRHRLCSILFCEPSEGHGRALAALGAQLQRQHGPPLTCGPRRPHDRAPEQTPAKGKAAGAKVTSQRSAYLALAKVQHALVLHAPAE